mmetsp:Transcript_34887/g.53501  ORF Transcript_34887/g.53501 Transcript_34887/m.53501 type:complete len:292 (+) Transcript_34887:95-970(+)
MSTSITNEGADEQQQRIEHLEWELSMLRQSTKVALEISWAEVERLEKANNEKENIIETLTEKIENLQMGIFDQKEEIVSVAPEEIVMPPRTGRRAFRRQSDSVLEDHRKIMVCSNEHDFPESELGNTSCPELLPPGVKLFGYKKGEKASTSSIPRRGSAGMLELGDRSNKLKTQFFNMFKGKAGIENDLMRQLHTMRLDKEEEMAMLEAKVKQREDAIETLEHAVLTRDEHLRDMRNQLDFFVQWKGEIDACGGTLVTSQFNNPWAPPMYETNVMKPIPTEITVLVAGTSK